MRWLKKSSETPQLLGLSSLGVDDSLSVSGISINLIEETPDEMIQVQQRDNQFTRKSRIGKVLKFFLQQTSYANN